MITDMGIKLEGEIPNDATHYFLWWDGLHVYKKEGKKWKWLINNTWMDIPKLTPVRGWIYHYVDALGYKHKLHKISKGALR